MINHKFDSASVIVVCTFFKTHMSCSYQTHTSGNRQFNTTQYFQISRSKQWALCICPKSVQKVIFCFKTSLELLTLVTAFPFSFASLSKIENTFIIK